MQILETGPPVEVVDSVDYYLQSVQQFGRPVPHCCHEHGDGTECAGSRQLMMQIHQWFAEPGCNSSQEGVF